MAESKLIYVVNSNLSIRFKKDFRLEHNIQEGTQFKVLVPNGVVRVVTLKMLKDDNDDSP